MIRPIDLHAEHHAPNTIGIGEAQPRLSWRFDGLETNWKQHSYTLEAHWPNGETNVVQAQSSRSKLVSWPWRSLYSCERCNIRVRVVGGIQNEYSPWSDWTTIETGILNLSEWACSLIEPVGSLESQRPVVFRTLLRCKLAIKTARLYCTAHGIYEARINGFGVSDQVLAPGWTSYNHRLLYQTYDVTQLMSVGRSNEIQITVADGWYCGRMGFNGGRRNIYGNSIGLLAKLVLHYIDDTSECYGTDDTWRWAYGPHLSASFYDGEMYDARIATPVSNFWQPVQCRPVPNTITSSDGPSVQRTEELSVQAIVKTPSGQTIVDFGQNFAGWVRLKIHSPKTCELTLRHAEVLEKGELGTRPLRTAQAKDTLIVPAGKSIVWEPKFTFHGFRFVQIDGWPGNVPATAVTGIVVHSDMKRTGDFRCSNGLLNRLHENVVWSMRSNFISIPTDCPQRDERLGWTGDINVFADTANYLFDTAGMLTSWLKDVAAEQSEAHGIVPLTVPNVMPGLDSEPHAIWGDAAVMLPWAMYTAFGDTEILTRQYSSMKAWLGSITRREDRLWDYRSDWKLGDWLDPAAPPDDPGNANTDPTMVSDAFLVHVVQLMTLTCNVLGLKKEAEYWQAEHARLKQAFDDEYISSTGRLAADTQTAYTLAVHFSLYHSSSQINKAAERLDYLVRRRSRFRIATGFAGTPYLGHAMTRCGLSNLFYRTLLEQKCPSWLYPVTMGATTMWERWDSMLPSGEVNPGEMTSFNHYALGSVGSWMYRTIVGLRPLEPGWSRFAVEPIPGGGLEWAEGSYLSGYGWCRVRWEIRRKMGERASEAMSFWTRVEIPPNTEAEVTLPGNASLQETLGSGCYEREVGYTPPEWPPRAIYARFAAKDDGLPDGDFCVNGTT